jgi:rSAM/selenodomain-associated transferase 2
LSYEKHPELSVVVPVYNEEENVASFLTGMARQQGVRMELILSDGGSDDGSVAQAERCREGLPFPLKVIKGTRGRAGQLNRGAGAAGAPTLLFLHIDSSFPDPLAFRKALDALAAAAEGTAGVAGHFPLQFHFEEPIPFPYRCYGAKAALDRPGCTHGDQGFLLSAYFFNRIGPFDTTLPLMEDTFLAEKIRQNGRWLLLPSYIQTSPRRFLSEGLLPRQTLNAILTNLAALGQFGLIEELKGCYQSQHAAQGLQLQPYFSHIKQWIAALPRAERRRFWYATGSYVRGNAWQIPFFFDQLRGDVQQERGGKLLAWHDRYLAPLLDIAPANLTAAALVWLWFKLVLLTPTDQL